MTVASSAASNEATGVPCVEQLEWVGLSKDLPFLNHTYNNITSSENSGTLAGNILDSVLQQLDNPPRGARDELRLSCALCHITNVYCMETIQCSKLALHTIGDSCMPLTRPRPFDNQ